MDAAINKGVNKINEKNLVMMKNSFVGMSDFWRGEFKRYPMFCFSFHNKPN